MFRVSVISLISSFGVLFCLSLFCRMVIVSETVSYTHLYSLLLPVSPSVQLSPPSWCCFLLLTSLLLCLLWLRCSGRPLLVGPHVLPWTVVGSWLPLFVLVFRLLSAVAHVWSLVPTRQSLFVIGRSAGTRCSSVCLSILLCVRSPPLIFSR